MRFVLVLGLLAVLIEPAHSESAQPESGAQVPRSGTQLIELCNRDMTRCKQLIGIIIKTGVVGEHLPTCMLSLNLDDLTEKILNWWKQYPERAENNVVQSVSYALRALNPC
jgi:hypothetical protein